LAGSVVLALQGGAQRLIGDRPIPEVILQALAEFLEVSEQTFGVDHSRAPDRGMG
jgi:hypothetical protein